MAGKRDYNARAPQVRVNVTEAIIEKSEQRDSAHCMIADAARDAITAMGFHPTYVSVDLQTIRWTDPDNGFRYTYLTPRSAQVALVQFDQGQHTEPFSFRLSAGQVTRSGTRGKNAKSGYIRPPTPAQEAASRANIEATRSADERFIATPAEEESTAPAVGGNAKNRDLSKAHLAPLPGRKVPTRNGGSTPPLAAGRRRAFGLRGLER